MAQAISKYPIPKPPFSVNQGHPLAQGLVCCFIPTPAGLYDAVGNFLVPISGSATIVDAQFGWALNCTGASGDNGAQVLLPSNTLWNNTSGATVLWRGAFLGTPSGGAACLLSIYDSSITSSRYGIMTGQSAPAVDIGTQTTPNYAEFGDNIGINSTYRDIVFSVNFHNGRCYENAQLINTDVNATINLPNAGTTKVAVGMLPGFGRQTQSIMAHGMIWNRAISAQEVQWLMSDPFAMLQTGRRFKTGRMALGGTIKFRKTLSGIGTGVGKRQIIGV